MSVDNLIHKDPTRSIETWVQRSDGVLWGTLLSVHPVSIPPWVHGWLSRGSAWSRNWREDKYSWKGHQGELVWIWQVFSNYFSSWNGTIVLNICRVKWTALHHGSSILWSLTPDWTLLSGLVFIICPLKACFFTIVIWRCYSKNYFDTIQRI